MKERGIIMSGQKPNGKFERTGRALRQTSKANVRHQNTMSDRGIIFSAPMVRAILDGRKTQTRRIMKPQPDSMKPLGKFGAMIPYRIGREIRDMPGVHLEEVVRCPYGVAGDRLWVRETFLNNALEGYDPVWFYKADDSDKPEDRRWRSSIHMPRAASRITLEITKVRVERLQDISEEDAKAEGVIPAGRYAHHRYKSGEDHGHRLQFRQLWCSLHGKGAWEKNPWVWVLEFRRVK